MTADRKMFLVKEANLEESIEAYKKWIEDFKSVRKREPTLEEKFKFVHEKDTNREIKVELNSALEEKIRKFVLKETMKEIQELYYDVEEPQEDYDWHCDKGMIKRTILSTIINVFQKLREQLSQEKEVDKNG